MKEKKNPKVKEEILQRIKAKTAKINRYQQRVSHFQQNRFFRNNEGQFYKQTDGSEEREKIVIPYSQEAKTFWTDIWDQEVEHNKDTTWLREIKDTTCLREIKKNINGKNKQARVHILQEKLKKILKKIPNWKAPGPDGFQGFWLKNFTSLQKNLVWYLNACLEGEAPRWMTKGRTVLIQKDKSKESEASNYCPITCLYLTWKLLTRIIAHKIYGFIENETKGYYQKSRKDAEGSQRVLGPSYT